MKTSKLDAGSRYLLTSLNVSGKERLSKDINLNHEYQITKLDEEITDFTAEIEGVTDVQDNQVSITFVSMADEKTVSTD